MICKRSISVCLLVIGLALPAAAKRLAPRIVPPVIIGHIRYSVPVFVPGHKQNGGYIQATHLRSRRIIGGRYIYRVQYKKNLEKDVQDVFITRMKRHPRKPILIIRNSRGQLYHFNVKTWRVYHMLKSR